eukprot:TRINITY_DN6469_c0_g1_i1.p1 TRINITY_DN6469_c0_g1~~TRINITY_DN6469_c0_g1_i1.p1  ORF type:complete len:398 (+),score=96.80 TRINITY_DN6469_c0_g1_i1:323-1516(+)
MESEQGKLFIGGISWETSEETLKRYFQKYGEVSEIVIMRDRVTGRARGFGFVAFTEPSVVERVLQDRHSIDGRQVELKKALPREEQQRNTQMSGSNPRPGPGATRTKKIFVGGLAPTVTEVDFRKHFEQFGNITDVVVMYDHVSNRPRGFGFITFDSEEAVDRVLTKNSYELHGKMVEVKRALPKEISPAGTRSRSSPMVQGYNTAVKNNRYGTPPPFAVRAGYGPPPYPGAAPVPGYFGGYVGGVNGGVGYPPGGASPAYGGAGYVAGAYGYGNNPYAVATAAGPYVSGPMAANYPAAGYGFAGGYATAPYAGPGATGAIPGGYQGATSGYGESFSSSPSSGNVSGASVGGYGIGGVPAQVDHSANGSAGYVSAGKQAQRFSDSRLRPYQASDRPS